jgi:sirohydrochlorin ferrochelatase
MKALLLVAHGSRRDESNEEVVQLASRLAAIAVDDFDLVEHAFLELAEPSIPDGIERCLHKGATSVLVLPYFLARGAHVVEHIPQQVAIKQMEHPEADIQITDCLGSADELAGLLLQIAR